MAYLLEHLSQIQLMGGLLALIVEVAVLGFGSLVLLFLGLSLLLSGALMWLGILPESLLAALLSNALLSVLFAVLLWKPLRRMQDSRSPTSIKSDFATESFVLLEAVDLSGSTTRRYSGVDWKLRSRQPIAAGTLVVVEKAEVGTFWVRPLEPQD
jgi:inner membrane protein